jgi:hypothetical protein
MMEMGGNTTVTITRRRSSRSTPTSRFPRRSRREENCVSHNGGIIPVPGRDLYVQGWYQGGVNVMDFTDADKAIEVALLRSRVDRSAAAGRRARCTRLRPWPPAGGRSRGTIGGSWGAYYWNGMIYSSEIDRGFDVYELTPSAQLSANEIAAAKLVQLHRTTTRRVNRSLDVARQPLWWFGRTSINSCATRTGRRSHDRRSPQALTAPRR